MKLKMNVVVKNYEKFNEKLKIITIKIEKFIFFNIMYK